MHQRVTIAYAILLCVAFAVQPVVFGNGENALVALGLRAGEFSVAQLLTYSLLHLRAGHLLVNLGVIAIFGAYLEACLGPRWLVLIMIAASVMAGLSHMALASGDPRALHGASGVAFALVTAAAFVAANRCDRRGPGVLLTVLILFATGLAALFAGPVAVSHAAHFGGALAGGLVALLWAPRGESVRAS